MAKQINAHKAKVLKKKDIVDDIIKENGISRNLSKVEKSKLVLDIMQNGSPQEKEEIVEEEEKVSSKTMHREFTCNCGMKVYLEGNIAQDKSIKLCSKCNKE